MVMSASTDRSGQPLPEEEAAMHECYGGKRCAVTLDPRTVQWCHVVPYNPEKDNNATVRSAACCASLELRLKTPAFQLPVRPASDQRQPSQRVQV
jgi:hypothetical protein